MLTKFVKPPATRWRACLLASLLAGCASTESDRGLVVNSPDGTPQHVNIPKQDYPPPGQCRIWTPGVLPQLQPAPGDCDQLKKLVRPGSVLVRG